MSDKQPLVLNWLTTLILSLLPTVLMAQSPPPPLFFAITPVPENFTISSPDFSLPEEEILVNPEPSINQDSTSGLNGVRGVVIKNYYSPYPDQQYDWNPLNLDGSPTAQELKSARRKLKALFPILTLGALYQYAFAGMPIDSGGSSYTRFYESILVLGGVNILSDGMAELLNEFGLDIIPARSAALIIMLVPAESHALYNDLTLDARKLSFTEALNHDAFKGATTQANHIVTELARPYVKERINARKYPGLDKMLIAALSSVAMATPPVLFQVAWGLTHGGNIALGKVAIDSGVGFMYSTAVTSFKGMTQQGAHVFLDSAKDPDWCDAEQRDCEKVDDDGVYSELLAGALCYLSATFIDLAVDMVPSPVPVDALPKGQLVSIVNNGLKIAPKIMKTTSAHLRKVTAYAGSDAMSKKVKQNLQPYTDEVELGGSLFTLITNIGLSYLSSMHDQGNPYKKGFGLRSVNAIYTIGAIATVRFFYFFGLNHALGLSGLHDYPPDYFSRNRETSPIYPNLEDDLDGLNTLRTLQPLELKAIVQ